MVKPRISFRSKVRPGIKLYVMRWHHRDTGKVDLLPSGCGIRALRHRFEVVWW